jgi:hypothetical protein
MITQTRVITEPKGVLLGTLTATVTCKQCRHSFSFRLDKAPPPAGRFHDLCPHCQSSGFAIGRRWHLAAYRLTQANLRVLVRIPEGQQSVPLAAAQIAVICDGNQCGRSVLLDFDGPASQLIAADACDNCILPSRSDIPSFEAMNIRETAFHAVERFFASTQTVLSNPRLTVSLAR